MDSITLFVIIALIAAVAVVEFYKRERARITSNLHNHNLKQLLTITALDYKFGSYKVADENFREAITKQVTQLVNSYENGEIQEEAFQKKMDFLLHKLN